MKTALMVDAACDLPIEFIERHDIHVIPINIQFMGYKFKDDRSPETTIKFYRHYARNKTAELASKPYTAEMIRNLIIKSVIRDYDNLLIMCITSTRSETYDNATRGAQMVNTILQRPNKPEAIRLKNIKVIDTKSFFSGQAVLAYEAVEILSGNQNLSVKDLSEDILSISQFVHTYVLLNDLFYVRHYAKQRGEKSVGQLSYALGKLADVKPIVLMYQGETTPISKVRKFDRAIDELFTMVEEVVWKGKGSLLVNAVMVSYAGNIVDIETMPRYQQFRAIMERNDIGVYLSVMSTAAGIYVGPGALTLSYCG